MIRFPQAEMFKTDKFVPNKMIDFINCDINQIKFIIKYIIHLPVLPSNVAKKKELIFWLLKHRECQK